VPLDFLDHRAAGLHFADIFRDCVKAFGIAHFGTPIVYLIILQNDCRVNKKITRKRYYFRRLRKKLNRDKDGIGMQKVVRLKRSELLVT